MGNGGPGVIPQFALGIGAPLTSAYSSGLPSLGAFTLTNTGLTTGGPALRGLSNVLLVSNLNEEVNIHYYLLLLISSLLMYNDCLFSIHIISYIASI